MSTLRPDYELTSREELRYHLLRTDLELVSEALQDPPCLEYRGQRVNGNRITPPVRTGHAVLSALVATDNETENALIVYRALKAHIREELRERAVDEVADESDDLTPAEESRLDDMRRSA